MSTNARANRILAYSYAIVALSVLFILIPTLALSSEIIPSAVKLCRKDSPELADLLEHYGDGCQSQARQLELFQNALNMRVRAGEKDERTAETIYKIWAIKRYWPEYSATWEREQLATEAAILGNYSERTISTRTMWALELSRQGKHKQSSNLMRENLKYLKQAPGVQDYQIVSMLQHMDGIFKANREPLKERAAVLEEAIKLSCQSNSEFCMEAIKSRLMLAELRSEMKDYAEAEKQFKICLTLSDAPLKLMRRDSLQDYADFLSKTGRKSKAQAYYAEAAQQPTGRCGTCEKTTIWKLLGIEPPL